MITHSLSHARRTEPGVCLSEYFHKHIKQANCVSFDSTNGLPLERHGHLAGFNVRRQCSFRASPPAHKTISADVSVQRPYILPRHKEESRGCGGLPVTPPPITWTLDRVGHFVLTEEKTLKVNHAEKE